MKKEVMKLFVITALFITSSALQTAGAALAPGLLDDFEDGTLGGWVPPVGNTSNVAGGPAGSTRALEIRPANRLAAFDAGINGIIDPLVTAIEVDMRRDAGTIPLEIRLVLFGPGGGNRWTSIAPRILPGDGLWSTYSFSLLEADLVRVLGAGSYSDLGNNLNRVMLRHDAGGPSPGGTPVSPDSGSFYIDNVRAVTEVPPIPLPAAVWLFGSALVGLVGFGRRRKAVLRG